MKALSYPISSAPSPATPSIAPRSDADNASSVSPAPPTLQLLRKFAMHHGGNDAHLTIAREYISQLWASVGEPQRRYAEQQTLPASANAMQVIRGLIADRTLLIHTLHGAEAAAAVAIGEMRGMQREVENIIAWSTLALMALACRGPTGVEVPGPSQFGHGAMMMFRKVRMTELMLTFTSAGQERNNAHAGVHFVVDSDDRWLVPSIDPALRMRDGGLPTVAHAQLFEAVRIAVAAAESSLRFFSAIVTSPTGGLQLYHVCAPSLADARRAVRTCTAGSFELFDGHINPCGNLRPVLMAPVTSSLSIGK